MVVKKTIRLRERDASPNVLKRVDLQVQLFWKAFESMPVSSRIRTTGNHPSEMEASDYLPGHKPPTQKEVSFNSSRTQVEGSSGLNYARPQGEKVRNQRQPRSEEGLTCHLCTHMAKTPSDLKKHHARHNAPWKCNHGDCPRSIKGFATINDLNRHEKSVHGMNVRGSKNYKCFAPNCPKGEKEWPRLDNFTQHLVRMHGDDDQDVLIRR